MDFNLTKIRQMNQNELRGLEKEFEEMAIKLEQGAAREQTAEDQIAELGRLYSAEQDKVLAEQRKLQGLGDGVSAAISIDGHGVVTVVMDGWWSTKQLLAAQNELAREHRLNHVKCSNAQREVMRKEDAELRRQAKEQSNPDMMIGKTCSQCRVDSYVKDDETGNIECGSCNFIAYVAPEPEAETEEDVDETNETVKELTQGDSNVRRTRNN